MKLKEALNTEHFTVTSEIQTPFDEEPEAIVSDLESVRGRVDGVSVVETEFNGVVGDTIRVCKELRQSRFEPIYRTSVRDKSRPQILKDLIQAQKAGVENILTFTDNYRISGDSLQEVMFFHVDCGKLHSVLAHLKEGRSLDGKELPAKGAFVLGAGVESRWGGEVPDMALREMEEMGKVGAGFFLTTPVFDLDRFEGFLKRAKTFGVPVIAEVMTLKTAGMATFLNRHMRANMVPEHIIKRLQKAPDRHRASVEIFAETVLGLKGMCQGVHIITLGRVDRLKRYLDAAKL